MLHHLKSNPAWGKPRITDLPPTGRRTQSPARTVNASSTTCTAGFMPLNQTPTRTPHCSPEHVSGAAPDSASKQLAHDALPPLRSRTGGKLPVRMDAAPRSRMPGLSLVLTLALSTSAILGLLPGIPAEMSGVGYAVAAEATSTTEVIRITPAEAQKLLAAPPQGLTVLDLRTPSEYNAGHIPGSVPIDFLAPDFINKISKLDRAKPYLIYCRTENRSGAALDAMRALEFKKVYQLVGGKTEWARQGLPLTPQE